MGIAQGALEKALQYASERKQFGQSINQFQGIQFKLADMATLIEAARNLLYKACKLKDAGLPFSKHAAISVAPDSANYPDRLFVRGPKKPRYAR